MTRRKLSRPPSLLGLDAKAAVGALPGAARLPFLGGGDGHIPGVELALDRVTVSAAHLARYRRMCGYRDADQLPITYPHVLAFPLHLALLTHRRFPFPALGLVHMANRIIRRRAIGPDEALDLRVRLTDLEPHPRGQSFEIVTEALSARAPVWEERCTIIHREHRDGSADDGASDWDEPAGTAAPTTARLRIPAATGLRYAVVSGDHNPIHVHAIPARVAGLPGVVAPGMWTKARALAAMELPAATTAEVEFRRPIVLPAEVDVALWGQDGERGFAVREITGKPYATGTVRPV